MNVLGRFDAWWLAPLDARPLAVLRVALGCYALFYFLWQWTYLTSSTTFEPVQFEPVGLASLLAGPLPDWTVYALLWAGVVTGTAFMLGWRFNATGPIFAGLLLGIMTYRNSWGQIYHVENLLVLHAIVLGLSPAADDLSLDARRDINEKRSGLHYGWPLRLCALLTVLTYFIAGWAKIEVAGVEWISSDALRNQIAYDNLRYELMGEYEAPIGTWLLGHGWVFKPLALLTLVIELGAPLALVNRRVALVWSAAAWLFHLGVLATMLIIFLYPLAGLAFLPLLAWHGEPIVATVRKAAHRFRDRRRMLSGWRTT